MYVGNLLLLILAIGCVPLFIKILKVPRAILNAYVLGFIIVGSYSLTNSLFNVGLTIGFGVLGFFMKKIDIPAPPLVLALVLGGMLESNLRRSLFASSGNPAIFFTRPISGVILVISIIAIFYPVIQRYVKQRFLKSNSAAAK
jgi:putative tricarboxylic transport membrane protein